MADLYRDFKVFLVAIVMSDKLYCCTFVCSLCDVKFVKSKVCNLQSVGVHSTKHSTENGLIIRHLGCNLRSPP